MQVLNDYIQLGLVLKDEARGYGWGIPSPVFLSMLDALEGLVMRTMHDYISHENYRYSICRATLSCFLNILDVLPRRSGILSPSVLGCLRPRLSRVPFLLLFYARVKEREMKDNPHAGIVTWSHTQVIEKSNACVFRRFKIIRVNRTLRLYSVRN